MDIFQYINQRNSLRSLSDDQFESVLPSLVQHLYEFGFERFLHHYLSTLSDPKRDWSNLVKKNVEHDFIHATSVVGMVAMKQLMPHLYEVKNYKGMCIKDQWTP